MNRSYKKLLRYVVLFAVLLLAGYNSVYFERLDQRKTDPSSGFDAEAYARTYLEEKLPPSLDKAMEINELLKLLDTEKEEAFRKYSHALGIGNIRFFLVRGEGVISAVREDHIAVSAGPEVSIRIATEYVFGNAIRDASGLIGMDEFDNSMELNDVSSAINKIIREEVLPPFRSRAEKGKRIRFTGAVELNQEYPDMEQIEVIPITLDYIEQ